MVPMLAALLFFGSDKPQVQRYAIKPWVVTVSHDKFTGAASCSAQAPHVRLVGERLIFDTGREVEPTEAAYRMDSGPAQRLSALTSDGGYRESFAFDPERDAREVFFNISDLAGVQKVYVRPDGRRAVATLDLAVLPKVIETEKNAGCGGL
jgi:hypothetical protein